MIGLVLIIFSNVFVTVSKLSWFSARETFDKWTDSQFFHHVVLLTSTTGPDESWWQFLKFEQAYSRVVIAQKPLLEATGVKASWHWFSEFGNLTQGLVKDVRCLSATPRAQNASTANKSSWDVSESVSPKGWDPGLFLYVVCMPRLSFVSVFALTLRGIPTTEMKSFPVKCILSPINSVIDGMSP